MTPDQEQRLATLAEKLAEVFLDEADPDAWTGAGIKPAEQEKAVRGDRQWDIKNANQIGLLFARALDLKQRVQWALQAQKGLVEPPDPTEGRVTDPEADIARFEREASKYLERFGRDK